MKNSATLAEDADSNFNYSNSCHSTDTPIVSDDSKDEAKDLVTAPTDECSNNNVEPPSKKIKLENEGTSTSSSEDSKTVDSPSKTVDTVDNASQEAKFNVNNEASVSSETAVDNCDDSNKKKVVPDSSLSDKLEIKEEKDLLVDNACDSTKTAEIIKTEVKCEVKEEPKDEGGDWDPTPHLPVPGEFELVATSVEELRALVLQFGELPAKPSKAKKKEGEEENQEEEEKEEESENDEEGKEVSERKLKFILLEKYFFIYFLLLLLFFIFLGTLFSRKLNLKNVNIKNKDNKISQGREKKMKNWFVFLPIFWKV